jgi:hypothetical protein
VPHRLVWFRVRVRVRVRARVRVRVRVCLSLLLKQLSGAPQVSLV